MTRDERIRAEEARAKAALPHATFAFGQMDPDNCRVIVDNAIFICGKFTKLGARLLAVKAGSEEAMPWPEGTYAWHQDARAGSTIWFRESVWLGDNDRAQHTICHELGHAAGAQLDSTPEGRAAKTRLMERKGMDHEGWADAVGAFFQRRPLPRINALAKLIWTYCR